MISKNIFQTLARCFVTVISLWPFTCQNCKIAPNKKAILFTKNANYSTRLTDGSHHFESLCIYFTSSILNCKETKISAKFTSQNRLFEEARFGICSRTAQDLLILFSFSRASNVVLVHSLDCKNALQNQAYKSLH